MTTASTADTKSSVDEAIRIFDAGGKLVRFTAPSIKEAKNLVDSAPILLRANVAKAEAEALKAQLEEAGAMVKIQ